MTGLGLTTSDVNIDVQICASSATNFSATNSSATNSSATNSSSTSSTASNGDSSKEADESTKPQLVVWSAAKVMVKIAQILKDESGTYDNVKTDFQVRIYFEGLVKRKKRSGCVKM